jgi:hypothetical protein
MFIRHRHWLPSSGKLAAMTSQNLAHTFEGFLSGSNNAVVIEDGAVVFDLGQARPTKLEICRDRDPRTRSAKRGASGVSAPAGESTEKKFP